MVHLLKVTVPDGATDPRSTKVQPVRGRKFGRPAHTYRLGWVNSPDFPAEWIMGTQGERPRRDLERDPGRPEPKTSGHTRHSSTPPRIPRAEPPRRPCSPVGTATTPVLHPASAETLVPVPESSPPRDVSATRSDERGQDGHAAYMKLTPTPPQSLADGWQACGCGEEQIPGLLAKAGFLGATALLLATLLIMTLTGWLLATAVWLLRRRRSQRSVTAPTDAPSQTSLTEFTWTAEAPR